MTVKRHGAYENTKTRNGSKPVDYYPWHRVDHHKKPEPNRREEVAKAFSNAWKEGTGFSIILNEYGIIRVTAGRKIIATYDDAAEFAREYLPEVPTE